MKNNLLFDFNVDKKAKTVFVNRELAADHSLVWDAFTKQEILDQWWTPKPCASKAKFMNFKVGGRRFYAMASPTGVSQPGYDIPYGEGVFFIKNRQMSS